MRITNPQIKITLDCKSSVTKGVTKAKKSGAAKHSPFRIYEFRMRAYACVCEGDCIACIFASF